METTVSMPSLERISNMKYSETTLHNELLFLHLKVPQ